nr:hypothetical protein [Sphingomonas crusticola]
MRFAFQLAGLRIQPPDRGQFFGLSQLGPVDRALHHRNRAVVNLDRDRKGMAVLAAMGEREARRIAEPARRAMDHFRHHRQRPHGAGANAGNQQQFGKILRSPLRCGRKIAVQPPRDHVLAAYVVMIGHDQMRQHGLRRRWQGGGSLPGQLGPFAGDAARADRTEQVELSTARGLGAAIGEVDDHALPAPVNGGMWRIDEAGHLFRQPMIAARLPPIAVHPLLHDDPLAVVADDEAVQVEIEIVLHGGAIDFGNQAAGLGKRGAIHADLLANHCQLVGRAARMTAAAAADVDAQFPRQRRKPALECTQHAGGDPGRMPVHPHHRSEGLKPEWMGQPAEEFVAAIFVDDRLRDHRAELGHPLAQPRRNAPAMQRKVCATGPLRHQHTVMRKGKSTRSAIAAS